MPNSSSYSIQADGSILRIEGDILFDNALFVRLQGQHGLERLAHSTPVVFDFAGVKKVDSSVMSVLLCWLRFAKRHQYQLQFANLPERVLALLDMYGMKEFL